MKTTLRVRVYDYKHEDDGPQQAPVAWCTTRVYILHVLNDLDEAVEAFTIPTSLLRNLTEEGGLFPKGHVFLIGIADKGFHLENATLYEDPAHSLRRLGKAFVHAMLTQVLTGHYHGFERSVEPVVEALLRLAQRADVDGSEFLRYAREWSGAHEAIPAPPPPPPPYVPPTEIEKLGRLFISVAMDREMRYCKCGFEGLPWAIAHGKENGADTTRFEEYARDWCKECDVPWEKPSHV